jgi:hypothetical protein
MSIRTTAEEIQAIIDVKTGFDLTSFMSAANQLVDKFCLDVDYSEEVLTRIETWLAAHFYCMYDPRATSESAGVSTSYEGTVALGLSLSKYGQMAMLLDTAGGLASYNKSIVDGTASRVVGVAWLGTDNPEY